MVCTFRQLVISDEAKFCGNIEETWLFLFFQCFNYAGEYRICADGLSYASATYVVEQVAPLCRFTYSSKLLNSPG